MLHVLFILLHRSSGFTVRGEPYVSFTAGPAVVVVMDEDINRVGDRAKPLSNLLTITSELWTCRSLWCHLLSNSEWQSSHVQTEHATPAPGSSHHSPSVTSSHPHTARGPVAKEVVREVAASAGRPHPSEAHPVPVVRPRPHRTSASSHRSGPASHGHAAHLLLSSPGLLHAGAEHLNVPAGIQNINHRDNPVTLPLLSSLRGDQRETASTDSIFLFNLKTFQAVIVLRSHEPVPHAFFMLL